MKGFQSLEKSNDKDIKDFLKTLEKLTRTDNDFKTKYKTLKQDANTIDEFYEGIREILDIEPVSKKQRDRPLKKNTPTWRQYIREETKERIATISYHKSAKSKLKPRVLKERKLDFKGKFLNKLLIRTRNVGNLEDLFDLIKEYVSNNDDAESIVILFKLRGRNKVRGMTLPKSELFENSFEEFEAIVIIVL
jgi:DNA segregation ATPase FtsK/SpoIIIE-like protein